MYELRHLQYSLARSSYIYILRIHYSCGAIWFVRNTFDVGWWWWPTQCPLIELLKTHSKSDLIGEWRAFSHPFTVRRWRRSICARYCANVRICANIPFFSRVILTSDMLHHGTFHQLAVWMGSHFSCDKSCLVLGAHRCTYQSFFAFSVYVYDCKSWFCISLRTQLHNYISFVKVYFHFIFNGTAEIKLRLCQLQ